MTPDDEAPLRAPGSKAAGGRCMRPHAGTRGIEVCPARLYQGGYTTAASI